MLWGNSRGSLQVFAWQRKAVRILANLGYQDDCRKCFIEYNIMTLPCIFIFQNLMYVKENQNDFICVDNIHHYDTRRAQDIVLPSSRLRKTIVSHKYLQIKCFNKLPLEVRNLNIKPFSTQLSSLLLNEAFYSLDEFLKHKF